MQDKKNDVKKEDYFIPIEELWKWKENKYEAISELIKEAKRLFEVSNDRETKFTIQAYKSLLKKYGKKEDTSGDNREHSSI